MSWQNHNLPSIRTTGRSVCGPEKSNGHSCLTADREGGSREQQDGELPFDLQGCDGPFIPVT